MMQHDFGKKIYPPSPLVTFNHKSLTTATAMLVNHDHAVVQLSLHMCDLNPTELIQAKIMRHVRGNNTEDVNFKTLLKGSKESVSLVTEDGQEGHWNTFKTRKNIRKEIFQMSQTTLLHCSILQVIAMVLVNVKAVTPRIRVNVQADIWNWSCNVRDVILHR
jgi:hypothetical protein